MTVVVVQDLIERDARTLEWLTTAPNPNTAAHGHDAGQRGWKLHAVEVIDDSFKKSRYQKSACGILPVHGWSLDLFIEDRCTRCAASLRARASLKGE